MHSVSQPPRSPIQTVPEFTVISNGWVARKKWLANPLHIRA
jgi:hypothetical protein